MHFMHLDNFCITKCRPKSPSLSVITVSKTLLPGSLFPNPAETKREKRLSRTQALLHGKRSGEEIIIFTIKYETNIGVIFARVCL